MTGRPPGYSDDCPENAPASAGKLPSPRVSSVLTVARASGASPGAASYSIGSLPDRIARHITIDAMSGCWEPGHKRPVPGPEPSSAELLPSNPAQDHR